MDLIDQFFTKISMIVKNNMSDNIVSNILSNGILPGLGGVIMFVPQIAILFFLLSILEETGYMSRISFLMDKSMRKIGLNTLIAFIILCFVNSFCMADEASKETEMNIFTGLFDKF